MDFNNEDSDIGTIVHPKGELRARLKKKLRDGDDPRQNPFFPGIVPLHVTPGGGLRADAIWAFVDREEIISMWKEIDHEDEMRKLLEDKRALDTVAGFESRLKSLCTRSFLWLMSWFVGNEKEDPVLQTLLKSEGGVMVTPGGTQHVDPADIIRRKILKKKE